MRHSKFGLDTFWDEHHQCYIKKATYESKKHLQQIVKVHKILEKEFEDKLDIHIVKTIYIDELHLGFSKAIGENLLQSIYNKKLPPQQALDHIVYILNSLNTKTIGDQTDIFTMFGKYGRSIYNKEDYIEGILDITASNIFLSEDNTYTLIDQERYCKDPAPRKLLIYRAINDMRGRGAINGNQYINICNRYGIKKRHIPIMKYQENYFQYHVGGGGKPNLITFLRYIYSVYAHKL